MAKNKTQIGYALRERRVDFGLMHDAIGKIRVDPEQWQKYVRARAKFEEMHSELIHKMKPKHKEERHNEIMSIDGER